MIAEISETVVAAIFNANRTAAVTQLGMAIVQYLVAGLQKYVVTVFIADIQTIPTVVFFDVMRFKQPLFTTVIVAVNTEIVMQSHRWID